MKRIRAVYQAAAAAAASGLGLVGVARNRGKIMGFLSEER